MFNRGDRNIKRCLSGLDGGSGSDRGRSLRVGTKKDVELLPGVVDCTLVDEPLLARFQCLGSRTISQTNLLVRPDGLDLLRVRHANVSVTTEFRPVLRALDVELRESLIDGFGEASDLLSRVTGGDGEPETFLATSNGGVVDGLHVDVVLFEERVGRDPRKRRVTNQHRDDVGWARNDGDVEGFEAGLHVADIELLQLPVAVVLLLVRDARASTRHVGRRKRRCEDEARSVRPDHVNEIRGAGDVTSNAAISLAKSAWKEAQMSVLVEP